MVQCNTRGKLLFELSNNNENTHKQFVNKKTSNVNVFVLFYNIVCGFAPTVIWGRPPF